MGKSSRQDASDTAIGFYFQACYALIVLLDASDEDSISVETADDVELIGKNPRLAQLKHSVGTPPALTEKNEGLWKTIGIWLELFPARKHHFVFVTCAEIDGNNNLIELANPGGNREGALNLLINEAKRVVSIVKQATIPQLAREKTPKQPYRERVLSCSRFLGLSAGDQAEFLRRITITHRNFNASDLKTEVEKRLANYPRKIRPQLAERLLEWWDRRIARSLTKEARREISKDELLERLHMQNGELADDNLPDDFSLTEPPSLKAELGSRMEAQIRLVCGGEARILRAAKARWQARNQRNRWIANNLGIATELAEFDKHLKKYWHDRHAPMRDDSNNQNWDETRKAAEGLKLLDWSHHDAATVVPQPRPKWDKAFLTQGTYQQLADELQIGWHPEYDARLKTIPELKGQKTNNNGPRKAKP